MVMTPGLVVTTPGVVAGGVTVRWWVVRGTPVELVKLGVASVSLIARVKKSVVVLGVVAVVLSRVGVKETVVLAAVVELVVATRAVVDGLVVSTKRVE